MITTKVNICSLFNEKIYVSIKINNYFLKK